MTARSPSESGHATDFGGAECVEALVECDADLNFGGLAVWVSCADVFPEGFEAAHFRLDPALGVVSRPTLPKRTTIMSGGAQGFVSGDRGRAILFPRSPVLADRDDSGGMVINDGSMASTGVIGAVGGDGANLFAFGNLVEQLWQDRTVTIAAGGELHGADVRSAGVHGQMDLAPLAPALNTVLARLPFAITEELEPGAVDEQVQGAIGAAIGDLDYERLLPSAQSRVVRHSPVQARQRQQAGHHAGRLPQRQLEQDLDRQTELDRRIGEYRWSARAPVMRRKPGHLFVQPYQQRATLLQ